MRERVAVEHFVSKSAKHMDKDEDEEQAKHGVTEYDLYTFYLDTRLHQTDAKNTHEDEDFARKEAEEE